MKKLISFLFCGMLFAFEANAIWPDFTPLTPAPQFCGQCTGEELKTVKSAISFIKDAKSRLNSKELFGQVEAAAKGYAMSKGTDFLKTKGKEIWNKYNKKKKSGSSAEEEKPISYTRVIRKTKTNVEDVEAVRDAFKRYFLYIPSKREEIQAAYKEKREIFVEDTTLELYIITKEMSSELMAMEAQLDAIQKCVVQGDNEDCKASGMEEYNCQTGSADEDEMCYRRNMLTAATLYDTIMKYNEYLIAMRAQYEAVRSIGSAVKPKFNKVKENKTSSVSGYFETSSAYAYEELDLSKEPLSVTDLPTSDFDFSDNNKISVQDPFADSNAEEMKALAVFEEAQKYVSDAIESHNLKQQLPSFKGVFELYHKTNRQHEIAVEQLMTSQQCVLNYLAKRYENSQKVWFDNCSISQGEGYVCKYSPAKSFSDNSESVGLYDVMCPDQRNQKCYKLGSTAYREVGGMSGWLINLYLNAKDELSEQVPDESTYVTDASSSDRPKDKAAGSGGNAVSAENLKYQLEGDTILVDKYKENMRALNRLNISIGMVANEEINKDTNGVSGPSKFNVNTKPFPLWNDQMNFYNQYIDGKYENIGKYFSEEPLYGAILSIGLKMNETYEYEPERDDDGRVVRLPEKIREDTAKEITQLLESLKDYKDPKITAIEDALNEEKDNLQAIKDEYKQQVYTLNRQRIALYKALEDINVNAANLNDEIEKQDSTISYADGYNSVASQAASMDKQYQNPKNPHKTMEASLNENIGSQKSKEKQAQKDKTKAAEDLARSVGSREDILNAISAKEREIENLKGWYVLRYHNAKQKSKNSMDLAIESEELSELAQAIEDAMARLLVLDKAGGLIEYIREYAMIQVGKAVEKLEDMKNNTKDSLYYAENNAKVVKIHTDMIESISKPDIDDIISELKLQKEDADYLKNNEESLTGIFSGLCNEISCDKPDSQYFVGILPQKRDLTAPKSPVAFSSAPLREMLYLGSEDIVYMDYFVAKDLKLKVTKYELSLGSSGAGAGAGGGAGAAGLFVPKKMKIIESEIIGGEDANVNDNDAKLVLMESSLPDSGIEIPEIWKVVLSYRPFVQKDIDLQEFLEHNGAESLALSRSGIYPCLVNGTIIDVVPVGSRGEVRYAKLSSTPEGFKNLQKCQTIGFDGKNYFDLQAEEKSNVISGIIQRGESILEKIDPSTKASELGNILEYNVAELPVVGENGMPIADGMGLGVEPSSVEVGYLTVRKEFLNAARVVNSAEDEDDFTADYEMYSRIMMRRGQFGDYLEKMDVERSALDGKERIKSKIYSNNIDDQVIVNLLYKAFMAMGYDFDRKKFDLTNEAYYKQAENVLNSRKEENLRKAKSLMGRNFAIKSEEAIKRKEELLRRIALLDLDSEELMSINGAETVDELSEKIKTQKADKSLQDLTKEAEEGNKSMTEKIEKGEPIYCSMYAE